MKLTLVKVTSTIWHHFSKAWTWPQLTYKKFQALLHSVDLQESSTIYSNLLKILKHPDIITDVIHYMKYQQHTPLASIDIEDSLS